jgi:hypothetical protein
MTISLFSDREHEEILWRLDRSAHACTRRGGPMNSGADNYVILYFPAVVGIGKDSSILDDSRGDMSVFAAKIVIP